MDKLQSNVLRIAADLPKGDPTRRQILEAIRQANWMGEEVPVKKLPAGVQRALKSIGYGRRDIRVHGATKIGLSDAGGDGRQGFFLAVDMLTGRVIKEARGSWGGPNPFQKQEMDDDSDFVIQPGVAALKGSKGGQVYCTITYHPSDKDSFIPEVAVVDISAEESRALYVLGVVSSYRADEWVRSGLPGKYSATNPLVLGLIAKGLVSSNKGGALALTTSGKNQRPARESY